MKLTKAMWCKLFHLVLETEMKIQCFKDYRNCHDFRMSEKKQ